MKYGYARVSTGQQDMAMQISALQNAGCEQLIKELGSGGRFTTRPRLKRLLGSLGPGDQLVVWKLDRLSRSLADLLFLLRTVNEQGASFCSLTEFIDTSTAAGMAMMQLIGVFAEFERSVLRERTLAGLGEARKRGVKLGPKFKLTTHQRHEVLSRLAAGEAQASIARSYGVHRSVICRLGQRIMAGHPDVPPDLSSG